MENGVSFADVAAMVRNSDSNGMNWNSPMWLIWAMLFGNGTFCGFGNRGQGLQDAEIMGQLNAIRQTMADNQNANAIGAGISANHEQLHGINQAICNAAMANQMSLKDIVAQMAQCCCDQKSTVLQQTNQLQASIANLMNVMNQGFTQVGFLTQQQTNELNNNANANTQRILDKMCADTTQELRDKLAEASQNAQTSYLISQLKTTATT